MGFVILAIYFRLKTIFNVKTEKLNCKVLLFFHCLDTLTFNYAIFLMDFHFHDIQL